jgi:hypothetical protein
MYIMSRHSEIPMNDIESLALDFEFGQLSTTEQQGVLAALGSEHAYTRMRTTLLATRAALTDPATLPQPAPHIRRDLHNALRQRNAAAGSTGSSLARVVGFRIPAYQALLAMAAVVAVMFLFRDEPNLPLPSQPVVRERVVYMQLAASSSTAISRDAIVHEVIDSLRAEFQKQQAAMKPQRVVWRERRRTQRDSTPASPKQMARRNTTPQPDRENQFVGLANLPQISVQKRGKSLAEDSAFSRFSTTMRRDTF